MKKEDLVLSTLSFYEPLSITRIILDMDLRNIEEVFSLEELEVILKDLEKRKVLEVKGKGNDKLYLKKFPKRSLIKRIKNTLT